MIIHDRLKEHVGERIEDIAALDVPVIESSHEIMTVTEAAALLKMQRRTLIKLMKDKNRQIPGNKVGGRWRISRAALLNFLQQK
jgi:excisionase family DNA binding protein